MNDDEINSRPTLGSYKPLPGEPMNKYVERLLAAVNSGCPETREAATFAAGSWAWKWYRCHPCSTPGGTVAN